VLERVAVPNFLPLYATVEEALDKVAARPPYLRDELSLAPTATAPAAARLYVHDMLQYWRLALPDQDVLDRAELLADELVTNAVVHARTPLRLRLELRGDLLHIAVHDGSPRLLRLVPHDPEGETGRGLRLVETLASARGVYRRPRPQQGHLVHPAPVAAPGGGPRLRSAAGPSGPVAQASASRRPRCSSTSKSALGQVSFMSSSCSTSRLAIAQLRYHLRSAGTRYQGARSPLQRSRAAS
jgi:anti-sigma regulatory factor (Ser/Thr protein kinase)